VTNDVGCAIRHLRSTAQRRRACDTHDRLTTGCIKRCSPCPSVCHTRHDGNSRYEQIPNISARFQYAILLQRMVASCKSSRPHWRLFHSQNWNKTLKLFQPHYHSIC